MSEINQIGLPKLDAKIQSTKNKKEPLASGKAFENQLLETVKKLKIMGNEVDAMMESTKSRGPNPVDATKVSKVNKKDVMAENISAADQASHQSAKFVALQYEQQSKK